MEAAETDISFQYDENFQVCTARATNIAARNKDTIVSYSILTGELRSYLSFWHLHDRSNLNHLTPRTPYLLAHLGLYTHTFSRLFVFSDVISQKQFNY